MLLVIFLLISMAFARVSLYVPEKTIYLERGDCKKTTVIVTTDEPRYLRVYITGETIQEPVYVSGTYGTDLWICNTGRPMRKVIVEDAYTGNVLAEETITVKAPTFMQYLYQAMQDIIEFIRRLIFGG